MPEEPDVEEPSAESELSPSSPEIEESARPEPPGIGSHVQGAVLLIAVGGLFWVIFKYGPEGANWLGNRTNSALGLTAGNTVETADFPETPEGVVRKDSSAIAADNVQGTANAPENASNSRISHARQVILEALGGPGNAEVQHIAISNDDRSMVAAVKFIGEDGTTRLEEIFFEQDEFQRYVSTDDAPLKEKIKIWKTE